MRGYVAASLFAAALLLAVPMAILVGLRTGNPAFFRLLRSLQRDVLNPRQLRRAGDPTAPWAVIRHTGRKSGRLYETPVGAEPTEHGFVIPLPYDTRSDWVRNVLAAGTATLLVRGREHVVTEVRLVPIGETDLAARMRFTIWLTGIHRALLCSTHHSPIAGQGRLDEP